MVAYGTSQYAAARALREAVLRRPLGLTLSAQDVQGEQDQLHYGMFDARGAALACVSVALGDAGRARVRQMAVAAALQGRGLGRALLQAVEADLRARGVRELMLHARLQAVGFYRRQGYRVVGEPFLEVGMPHRRMAKRLPEGEP
ncbi:GNAT family N-acetyltransferase [Ectothiorhodospiraceae bacterium 2226]|nr:GNAT family N-acetyltransferase [Ectothiorhodospiraceae bacterium 2226]